MNQKRRSVADSLFPIWEFVKNNPKVTTVEISKGLGAAFYPMAEVSNRLTKMYRRGMVIRGHRTFIRDDNARQQTNYEYTVVDSKFRVRPFCLVPVAPRSAVHVSINGLKPPTAYKVPEATQPTPVQTSTLPMQPVSLPPAHVEGLTEAEKFRAYLEFKAMMKAGEL
jgi:hypothetical protein